MGAMRGLSQHGLRQEEIMIDIVEVEMTIKVGVL